MRSEIGEFDQPEDSGMHNMAIDAMDSSPCTSLHLAPDTPELDYAPQDRVPFIEHFQLGAARAPISGLAQSMSEYKAL